MKPTRIAVVNSHPIQYFAPPYRFLNAAPDLDVTAIYLSDISIRGAAAELASIRRWQCASDTMCR